MTEEELLRRLQELLPLTLWQEQNIKEAKWIMELQARCIALEGRVKELEENQGKFLSYLNRFLDAFGVPRYPGDVSGGKQEG